MVSVSWLARGPSKPRVRRRFGGWSAFCCCYERGNVGLLTDGIAACAGSGPSRIMRQCFERAKSCRNCHEKSLEDGERDVLHLHGIFAALIKILSAHLAGAADRLECGLGGPV